MRTIKMNKSKNTKRTILSAALGVAGLLILNVESSYAQVNNKTASSIGGNRDKREVSHLETGWDYQNGGGRSDDGEYIINTGTLYNKNFSGKPSSFTGGLSFFRNSDEAMRITNVIEMYNRVIMNTGSSTHDNAIIEINGKYNPALRIKGESNWSPRFILSTDNGANTWTTRVYGLSSNKPLRWDFNGTTHMEMNKNGNLDINNNLNVDGNLTVDGTYNVKTNIYNSSGSVTINDALVVTGSISDSNGDVKINDGLVVTGDISDDGGSVTIDDGLVVTGNISNGSSNSDVKINDGLIVTGDISDDGGNVTINDGLVITGNISDSNSDVTIADGLSVTGSSTLSGGLTVTGGNIVADAVTLNVGSFPDYVFEKDYNLMSLSEVEAHINQFKRLPNMPSESEVLENGMDTGKINVLLVEKVEELTLHTIAQEKKIEELKAAVAELLERLDK